MGNRSGSLVLWSGGSPGLGSEADGGTSQGARTPDSLVQSLRSANGLGGHHASQGGRGLILLQAFPHGSAARGWIAQAKPPRVYRNGRHTRFMPVVPFRGSQAG